MHLFPRNLQAQSAEGPFFILFINYTGDDKLSTLHHKLIFMHFLDQDKGNIFNIDKYWAGFYVRMTKYFYINKQPVNFLLYFFKGGFIKLSRR